eukprot:g1662.t1
MSMRHSTRSAAGGEDGPTGRGKFLSRAAAATAAVLGVASSAVVGAGPASALVKGNAPPPGYNKKRGSGYGNGEPEAAATAGASAEDGDPSRTFSVTKTGIRFKDLKIGGGPEVKPSNVVDMRYRVEKLGKRSYDGISGETQSVFSLGYGEDDDKEGDVLTVPLGSGRLVSAVDEGVVGMRVGGVRRVAVRPERGWKKQDPKCATEIDMGVMSGVPGAALAKVEDCIDLTLEPKPVGYGATRRMARRFDETLIVESLHVTVVEARGLMARDAFLGRSDPYVNLDLSGRAGAFLRVELWDWNRGIADDHLGRVEIKIGEELLSQKAVDMWFVLDAPRDLKKPPSFSGVEVIRETEQQQQPSEVEEEINAEVRLELRFEFNEFGETCSHMWPEEPPKPSETTEFSPNRLYYNTLLVQELAWPYVSFVIEVINVVYWVRPWNRAGAFLRVEVWDWDRGKTDDPLGSFEVKIGEELLSQKEEEEEEEDADAMAASTTSGLSPTGWNVGLGWRHSSNRKSRTPDGDGLSTPEHNHSPGEESDVCDACIQYRRDHFGEVRLELRFEFNEFGETCSHVWPEEPPKPVETTFSPNRVYYNGMLLHQLAQPYVSCMRETCATVHWVKPWKSLLWFIALVVLLLRPCLMIVAINVALIWRVVTAYLEYTFPHERNIGGGSESSNNAAQRGPNNESARVLGMGRETAAATSTAGRASSAATKKGGAPEEQFAGPVKQKSVRFKEGTVGGEVQDIPLPRTVGGTTRAPPAVNRPARDLWKLGKGSRTWKGAPSSGTPTYGSIDDITSDEEGGNWDEEKGGDPAERGILTTPRWSFHADIGGHSSTSGNYGGGGAESDAPPTPFHDDDDSPRGKDGWRGRFSKWYHDF